MDELNSFVRKAFLFLIALYPWINYVARKVPLLGTVFDDLLVITFLVYALIVGRNRVVKIFESPTVLFAMLFVAVSLFSFFFNDYLFLAFQHQFRLFIAANHTKACTSKVNIGVKHLRLMKKICQCDLQRMILRKQIWF